MFPPRRFVFGACFTALALVFAAMPAAFAQGGPGVLQVSSQLSFAVVNGHGVFTINLSRINGQTGAVGATYQTVDDTALAGRDYEAASGSVSWADGDAADKVVKVKTLSGLPFAGTRVFNLVLSEATGGATLGQVSARLTLQGTLTAPQPTVALTSPPAALTLTSGDSFPLAAGVTDPAGILVKVQFLIDGQLVGEARAPGPYTFTAVVPAGGVHQLSVVAIDTAGRQSIGTQTLNVLAADPANPAPAAAIVTDLEGRALPAGAKVSITASGLGADGEPVQQLDLYADGVLFDSIKPGASAGRGPIARQAGAAPGGGAAAGSVFQARYTMPGVDKLISIISVAISRAGHTQVSAPVTVQAVANSADRAPKVKVGGFVNGAQLAVGAKVTVPVSVSDPDAASGRAAGGGAIRRGFDVSGVIQRVEYYLNNLKVKDAQSAPYSYEFSPPSAGVYVLSAIATDGAGLSAVSKPVTVEAVASTIVTVATIHDGQAAAGGIGKVRFSRTGDVSSALNVAYRLKGDAVNGEDYLGTDGQPLNGTFTIPAGASSKKLKVSIAAGARVPGTIKIKLLADPAGEYQLGAGRTAKILITDAP